MGLVVDPRKACSGSLFGDGGVSGGFQVQFAGLVTLTLILGRRVQDAK